MKTQTYDPKDVVVSIGGQTFTNPSRTLSRAELAFVCVEDNRHGRRALAAIRRRDARRKRGHRAPPPP
jgi:hypothetical protein